jgi:polysaccharide deacetylase family protein (PEP-CTERM system associated)
MKNIITVDVEDWYHGNDINIPINEYNSYQDRIINSTTEVLDLFSQYNIKATFFVLGCIAQKHPEIVRRMVADGHEIGSHGFWHSLVYQQKEQEFRRQLLDSKHILEDITGSKVQFYRAPSWSISRNCLWALEILEEEGFICDSSVHPFKTPLYGIKGAPAEPYHPIINGKTLGLLEYPPTVLKLGKCIFPIAGGLYLRTFPCWFTIKALEFVNKGSTAMVYTHPWEMDTEQPVLKVSPLIKLTHYYNLHTTKTKLEKLLQTFEFAPLGEVIKNGNYPALTI